MFTILPYCLRDANIMLPLLRWMNQLGGCKKHDLVLLYDLRVLKENQALVQEIAREAEKCFANVIQLPAKAEIDGWPAGANYMFRTASAYASYKVGLKYWMWLEPDAIPLSEGWLDRIEQEYLRCGKPFMGDRVEVENVPLHMSGVGVYPNPLYQYAGEAYRASDTAWDMAGKDQIIPKAHFTELIEHAWKHPSFAKMEELDTQISKKTVIFHASKDGSLINLLQQRKAGDVTCAGAAVSVTQPVTSSAAPTVQPAGAASITCDIFIRTYPQDYLWLNYCLQAIQKYAKGFGRVWIVTPKEIPPGTIPVMKETIVRVMNEESEDGYLSQQIHKLYADVITDYQPDYILHIDSDVILTQEIRPEMFFDPGDKKLIWLHTPYWAVQTPWKPIIEKFMCQEIQFEFMRRFPLMMPRWLYPKLREFCYRQHKRIISEYIRTQPQGAFSEFNALGAYAWVNHKDQFHWIDTTSVDLPVTYARQFRSYDGITPGVRVEIEKILVGNGERITNETQVEDVRPDLGTLNVGRDEPLPATTLRGTVAAGESTSSMAPTPVTSAPVPQHIKKLPNNIWIIEGDTHIGKWVEQEGRLDHDQNTLPFILPHIRREDTVIDAGANIGDHTIAYARAVGEKGLVYAFEPNPLAFACLKHNMEPFPCVACCNTGLSDKDEIVPISGNNNNYGGSYVGEHMKVGDAKMERLDDLMLNPHFIKVDVEGYELKMLEGATKTITECRPKMVIEVNREALNRQGFRPDDIFAFLNRHAYHCKVMQENCTFDSPLYDIYCWPAVSSQTPSGESPNTPQQPASPEAPTLKNMMGAVLFLKAFADIDTNHRIRVMLNLSKNGLTPRWPKRKKARKGKPK